ncbi:MAG TPA: amidohydrolase [Propionibacterium sp.]|nr:amidohydrolase [Propionibacterium sp.]
MLVHNAKVFTGEGESFAFAFRIEEGRFTWVGTDERVPEPAPGEEVLDLGGATVLPGLLDVHTHPALMASLMDAVVVLPPAVSSIDEMVEALKGAEDPEPDDPWIEGHGYDDSRFPEHRSPNRHDLDRVSDTRPIFVRRCDVHTAVVNSVALEMAGITRDTPDPPHAEIGRDAEGEPDGLLLEPNAIDLVYGLIPSVPDDKRISRMARLDQHFLERGIVAIGDLASTFSPKPLELFRAAREQSWLPRLGLYPIWEHIKDNPPVLSDEDRSGEVFIAGVKILLDGAYSNATAWTNEPYPGTCDHGIRTTSPEDLADAAAWARANGVQLAVHAMGDAAIDAVLDEFADEEGWLGDLPSVRIEHSTLFSPEMIARVRDARMPIAVVSHTIFFFAEYKSYEQNLSPEQARIAYPIRSFHTELKHTALSSDAPATAHSDADNVFVSVQAAVDRRSWTGAILNPDESVTVAQALELYTSRAATCMALPGLGRIEEGYEASFVVLDKDIFTIPTDDICRVHVRETWVRGQREYVA